MRRVFAVIGFSFLFTTVAVIRFPSACGYIIAAAALLLIIALAVPKIRRITALPTLFACVLISASLFLSYYNFAVQPIKALSGKSYTVNAVCRDFGTPTTGGYKYVLKVRSVDNRNDILPFKLMLYTREPLLTEPDDHISVKVTLNDTYASVNSDYGEGIFVSAYVGDSSSVEYTGKGAMSLSGAFCRLNKYLKDKLAEYMTADTAPLMKSLLFSDKSELEADVSNAFAKCGLQHTMAVSGLHLTIICGFIYAMLRIFGKSRRCSSIVGIVAVLIFMAIVGFRYSAVRAGIMMIIMLSGGLIGRRADGVNSLCAAATLLIIINPYCSVNISFLMSFCATLGMVLMFAPIYSYLDGKMTGKGKVLLKIISPFIQSVCACIAVLPIMWIFFGNVSLLSPIANMILLPIISLCVIIGALCCLFSPIKLIAAPLCAIASVVCRLVMWLAKALANLAVVVHIGNKYFGLWIAAALIMTAAAYLLIKLKFGGKRKIIRITAMLCAVMLLVCCITQHIYMRDRVTISLLQSGAGTTAVLNDNGSAVLIGAGGSSADAAISRYIDDNIIDVKAAVFPTAENRYSQNAANAVRLTNPDKIIMDDDGDKIYAVKSAAKDSPLYYCSNSEVRCGRFIVNTYASGSSTAVLVRCDGLRILFIDKSVDVSALPDDYKSAQIAVVAGNSAGQADKLNAQSVIFCTNRRDVGYSGSATAYYTSENDCLTVITDGNSYKLENI